MKSLKLPLPRTNVLPGHLYLLTFLVIAQTLMLTLEPPGSLKHPMNIGFAVGLGLLLEKVTGRRRDTWILIAIGVVPAVADLLVPWDEAPLALNAVKTLLWLAFPFVLGWKIIAWISRLERVTAAEVSGAVAGYVLSGVFFANLYELYALYIPGAISWSDAFESPHGFGDFVYFSFVTMTSAGYGDVTPVDPLARMTVVAQAIFGLVYMAVLVARFVSQLTTNRLVDEGKTTP